MIKKKKKKESSIFFGEKRSVVLVITFILKHSFDANFFKKIKCCCYSTIIVFFLIPNMVVFSVFNKIIYRTPTTWYCKYCKNTLIFLCKLKSFLHLLITTSKIHCFWQFIPPLIVFVCRNQLDVVIVICVGIFGKRRSKYTERQNL